MYDSFFLFSTSKLTTHVVTEFEICPPTGQHSRQSTRNYVCCQPNPEKPKNSVSIRVQLYCPGDFYVGTFVRIWRCAQWQKIAGFLCSLYVGKEERKGVLDL